MNRSVTAESMHQISTSRSSINLKTKTISSEIAYSNQSTRTLTTTPLQTYIVVNASNG